MSVKPKSRVLSEDDAGQSQTSRVILGTCQASSTAGNAVANVYEHSLSLSAGEHQTDRPKDLNVDEGNSGRPRGGALTDYSDLDRSLVKPQPMTPPPTMPVDHPVQVESRQLRSSKPASTVRPSRSEQRDPDPVQVDASRQLRSSKPTSTDQPPRSVAARQVNATANTCSKARGRNAEAIPEANDEEDDPPASDPKINDDKVASESLATLPIPEEESGTSGSDYAGLRAGQLLQRRNKAKHGQAVTDTEAEDAELDEEHHRETHSDAPLKNNKTNRKRDKQPARSQTSGHTKELDEAEGDDDDDDEPEDNWHKATGPLPQAACVEAQELGVLVKAKAAKIARKYNKSIRQVMYAVSLGIRPARAKNLYNLFKKWYAHRNPNKDMSYVEFGKHMTEVYRDTILSIEDPDERADALKPIYEYADSLDVVENTGEHALKSMVNMMQNAREQFTTLAAAFHNLEEIEVVGAIIYTGTDAGARQTSTLFGGSDLIKEALAGNPKDVRAILDNITTAIKSAELKKRGIKMSSVIGIDVERRHGESNRDRDRRVLTAILQESLDNIDDMTPKSMPWKKWLKLAMESQIRIVNWPAHVVAPGPSFDFKKIRANHLADMVKDYIDNKQGGDASLALVPKIERWTDDEKACTDDVEKDDIPLVVSVQGEPLRKLEDCPEWIEEMRKKAKKGKKGRKGRKGRSRSIVSNRSTKSRDNESDVETTDGSHPSRRRAVSSRPQGRKHKSRKANRESASDADTLESTKHAHRHRPSTKRSHEETDTDAPSDRKPNKDKRHKVIDTSDSKKRSREVADGKKQIKDKHREVILVDSEDDKKQRRKEGSHKVHHGRHAKDKAGHRSDHRRTTPEASTSSAYRYDEPPFTQSTSHQDTRPAKRRRYEESPPTKSRHGERKVERSSKGHRYKVPSESELYETDEYETDED